MIPFKCIIISKGWRKNTQTHTFSMRFNSFSAFNHKDWIENKQFYLSASFRRSNFSAGFTLLFFFCVLYAKSPWWVNRSEFQCGQNEWFAITEMMKSAEKKRNTITYKHRHTPRVSEWSERTRERKKEKRDLIPKMLTVSMGTLQGWQSTENTEVKSYTKQTENEAIHFSPE